MGTVTLQPTRLLAYIEANANRFNVLSLTAGTTRKGHPVPLTDDSVLAIGGVSAET